MTVVRTVLLPVDLSDDDPSIIAFARGRNAVQEMLMGSVSMTLMRQVRRLALIVS